MSMPCKISAALIVALAAEVTDLYALEVNVTEGFSRISISEASPALQALAESAQQPVIFERIEEKTGGSILLFTREFSSSCDANQCPAEIQCLDKSNRVVGSVITTADRYLSSELIIGQPPMYDRSISFHITREGHRVGFVCTTLFLALHS